MYLSKISLFVLSFGIINKILPPKLSDINNSTDKKYKFIVVPKFGYSPETNFYFGLISLGTFHLYSNHTRTSNLKLEIDYTLNKQFITGVEWNYFFNNEQWFTTGQLSYNKYPDIYYGLSSAIPDQKEVSFLSYRQLINIELYKNINRKFFVGGGWKYENYYNIDSNLVKAYTELIDSYNISLVSAVYYDSRDNILNTTNGQFLSLKLRYNWVPDRSPYLNTELDIRKYYRVDNDIIFTSRFYSRFTFGIPNFYDYSVLGGDKYVRGFFYGKFRDKHLSTLQLEGRTPELYRCRLALILGVSNIYSSFDSFSIDNSLFNYGLGFRFLIDRKEKVNIRFDYVLGSANNDGFYIGFGESF